VAREGVKIQGPGRRGAGACPSLTSQWSGRPTARVFWRSLALVPVGRRSPGALGDTLPSMSKLGRNKAVLRRFVDAINRQDWSELKRLLAPDFVRIAMQQANRSAASTSWCTS
jgi:hypothetical protein